MTHDRLIRSALIYDISMRRCPPPRLARGIMTFALAALAVLPCACTDTQLRDVPTFTTTDLSDASTPASGALDATPPSTSEQAPTTPDSGPPDIGTPDAASPRAVGPETLGPGSSEGSGAETEGAEPDAPAPGPSQQTQQFDAGAKDMPLEASVPPTLSVEAALDASLDGGTGSNVPNAATADAADTIERPLLTCDASLYPPPESSCSIIAGQTFPFISAGIATDISAAGAGVFASFADAHTAAFIYQSTLVDYPEFSRWACFGGVPNIARIAVSPGSRRVVAVSSFGELFFIESQNEIWSSWTNVAGPDNVACVTDAAVTRSADDTHQLFAAADGIVYTSFEPSSPVATPSPWRVVAETGGNKVAALLFQDRPLVLALDGNGLPVFTRQSSTEPEADFEGLSDLGSGGPAFQALDALLLPSGTLTFVGLDNAGAVWRLQTTDPSSNPPWQAQDPPGTSTALKEITATILNDESVFLFGLTDRGVVAQRPDEVDGQWDVLAQQNAH